MNLAQFENLKLRAQSFRSETAKVRRARLQKLSDWLMANEPRINEALRRDFNKPEFETRISETMPSLTEVRYAIRHLAGWMRNQRVHTPLSLFGYTSHIRYENKGVVLIISPWNYPFQLAVVPLIAALASGNTVVIKPSELTPHTSELIRNMCESCFEADVVTVEVGGREKTEELLQYRFDHVFFTGSTQVGRIIARACAEKLIPVTLELGGKSPTFVDETCDLKEAAEKIFWGKFLNRAQTCVAPDYLVVHESVADDLIARLKKLSEDASMFDKARIITETHRLRLQKMANLKNDINLVPLEVVSLDNADHPLMQEEIFGPVLPVLRYRTLDDLSALVNTEEKPLSLYIFSKSKSTIETILQKFPSGGAGINAVLVQFGNHHLPFGGVGASGAGNYHGYFGFLEMSHKRAVIEQRFFSFMRVFLMPPYTPLKQKLVGILKATI
jgi:aldehyde dehydrogenase (NAD+)